MWIRLTTKDKLEKTELFDIVFNEGEIAQLAEALRMLLRGWRKQSSEKKWDQSPCFFIIYIK
ncbi:MAG: hypothetical protein K8R34_15810 [Methanosarcinales archaeon]|nr:hypothetical protein [Methanosarcinales archaeon]MCD4809519.1 hypothetical protein [Methanosarcinales archaeon]